MADIEKNYYREPRLMRVRLMIADDRFRTNSYEKDIETKQVFSDAIRLALESGVSEREVNNALRIGHMKNREAVIPTESAVDEVELLGGFDIPSSIKNTLADMRLNPPGAIESGLKGTLREIGQKAFLDSQSPMQHPLKLGIAKATFSLTSAFSGGKKNVLGFDPDAPEI